MLVGIEFVSPILLPKHLVNVHFQIMVEFLEKIFKKQGQHLAGATTVSKRKRLRLTNSQFQPLISNIIPIIHKFRIMHSHQYSTYHESDIKCLGPEIQFFDRDMSDYDRG